MPTATRKERNPWLWIPSLYLVQGLPYTMIMLVSVIMYKRLGISNTEIALYTSWLNLPWVIKPLWSPLVDLLRTRRMWIWVTQLVVGAGLASVAFVIPLPNFFQYSLALLFLLAFSSATHDIAADGFYMLALSEKQQSFFVGVRSTFFRIALIFGQGILVIIAGLIESNTGLPTVNVSVHARPETAIVQSSQPPPAQPAADELQLISSTSELNIAAFPRERPQVQTVLSDAKAWNLEHGFTREERSVEPEPADSHSWWNRIWATWDRAVKSPLEGFLRQRFGPKELASAPGDLAGNVGLVEFKLSGPPGRDVVVTFGHESGDKSVSLVEGARLVFNDANWNVPARAVIQLDPKLDHTSAAVFQARSGNIPLAWSLTIGFLALMILVFAVYHRFILPVPDVDRPGAQNSLGNFFREFFHTFGSYFRKPGIVFMLLFLLFYRFAEAQLVKLAAPFLLDAREVGGLGLTTGQVGFVYGTVGVIALTAGGLLGGFVAARHGLKRWIWWMALAINLPNGVYVYLSHTLPDSLWIVNLCVAIEQFGYGFGFAAYLLYMIFIAQGEHRTAHYAICTGFMALGMMIPGMFSGWLQDIIGYQHFFIWVMLATIPAFIAVKLIPLDADFGRKEQSQ